MKYLLLLLLLVSCTTLDSGCREIAESIDGESGTLLHREHISSYFSHMIDVENLTFQGIDGRFTITRIDDGTPLEIGAFYTFNTTGIELFNPLAGSYGGKDPESYANRSLNKLEKINC